MTPGGRYVVVRGRLWRCSDPGLDPERCKPLVAALMLARRGRDRAGVDAAKRLIGERGEFWLDDGAPDWNRHLARNTPYADWFARSDDQMPPGTAG